MCLLLLHTFCVPFSLTTHNARWTNAIISFPQYFSIILLPLLLLLLLLLLTLILIFSSSLFISSSCLHSRNVCCNAFQCPEVLPIWRVHSYPCEAQSHLSPGSHLYAESWDFWTAGFVNIKLFRGAKSIKSSDGLRGCCGRRPGANCFFGEGTSTPNLSQYWQYSELADGGKAIAVDK